MAWISVRKYSQKIGTHSPQVIYNKIYQNKFKGKWRKVKKVVESYEIYYEEDKARS